MLETTVKVTFIENSVSNLSHNSHSYAKIVSLMNKLYKKHNSYSTIF